MGVTRLSSKGQVVIPQLIREARHWGVGTQFEVHEVKEGVLLTPIFSNKKVAVHDLLGCLSYQGPKKSLQDMDAAIFDEARKKL